MFVKYTIIYIESVDFWSKMFFSLTLNSTTKVTLKYTNNQYFLSNQESLTTEHFDKKT